MSDQGLRASDADREAAVTRLHKAATEGRIDAEELDQRITAAYAAKHCVELDALTSDITPAGGPSPPPPAPAAAPVFVQAQGRTNGLAIASLVCGLVWLWWLGSIAAIVMGHVALKQIARSRGTQSGRGLAIAGLVLGYLGAAMLLIVLIGVAVS